MGLVNASLSDYVGYMAKEVVKRLLAGKMIEAARRALTEQVRKVMADEVTVEDRINEEVREILSKHSDEMRRTGVSYQEMYKKGGRPACSRMDFSPPLSMCA